MAKKNTPDKLGFVYSTNPDFRFEEEMPANQSTLTPGDQKLKIKLDTRQRAGKVVTLLENFVGTEADLDELGKKLKNFCGSGGSIKDREILIQGDHRDKVLQWLIKNGYKNTRKI